MSVPIARQVLPFLALSGCVAGKAVMQKTTRSLARTAVDAAAGRYLPGVDVQPYSDCVIDNASTADLLDLATAASVGGQEIAARTWPVVRTVASRPETTQCLLGTLPGGQLLTAQGLAIGGIE